VRTESFEQDDEPSFDFDGDFVDLEFEAAGNKLTARAKKQQKHHTKKRIEQQLEDRYFKRYHDYLDDEYN
jgi:hypothetical protein